MAVGLAAFLVPLADTTRYALLAQRRVGRTIGFDVTWTASEIVALVVLTTAGTVSPEWLLFVWSATAALAVLSIWGSIRPAAPRISLLVFSRNPHWWRLCANESIITGSSYAVLAFLAIVAGTDAVGALRASLLPYLWVQLVIAATWLVILSRPPALLKRVVRLIAVAVLGGIVMTAAVVKIIPMDLGERLFENQWHDISALTTYAALSYAGLTIAELVVVQLKARATARPCSWPALPEPWPPPV